MNLSRDVGHNARLVAQWSAVLRTVASGGGSRALVSGAAALAGADQAPVVDEAVEDGEGVGAVQACGFADVGVGDWSGLCEAGDDVAELVGAES